MTTAPLGKSDQATALVKAAQAQGTEGGAAITKAEAGKILAQAEKMGISQSEIECALVYGNYFDLAGARQSKTTLESQQDLMSMGYSVGNKGADGKMGFDTTKAVQQFQKEHGITPANGILNEKTRGAIKAEAGKVNADDKKWAEDTAAGLRKEMTAVASKKGLDVDKLMQQSPEALKKAEERGDLPPGSAHKLRQLASLEKGLNTIKDPDKAWGGFYRLHMERDAGSFGMVGVLKN